MTHIIHTADTHIGYTQYHLPEREQDFLLAFEKVVDSAIEKGVEAVVHAGDLFHSSSQPPRVHGELNEQLAKLKQANIDFLAVGGNHDAARQGDWLDVYEDAGWGTHLGAEPVLIDNVAFYGLDYVPPSKQEKLTYTFDQPPADAEHLVLVAHAQFAPLTPGNWDLREVLKQSNVAFDGVLLGDEHKPIITEVSGVPVTYPGSTERVATDEREPRGYNSVTFSESGISIERETIETRDFVYIDVTLDDGEGARKVRQEIDAHDIDDAVVEIRIDGEGEPVPLRPIEDYTRDSGALCVRARDLRDFGERDGEQIDIEFVDPEKFVEERVGALGLSPVVEELETDIRDTDSIAKSNLDDHTVALFGDRVTEAPEDFEPRENETESDGTETPVVTEDSHSSGATDGANDVDAGGDVDGDGSAEADVDGDADANEDADVDEGGGIGEDEDDTPDEESEQVNEEDTESSDSDAGMTELGDFI